MGKTYLVTWNDQVRKFSKLNYAKRFYSLMKLHGINCELYYKLDKQPELYEIGGDND